MQSKVNKNAKLKVMHVVYSFNTGGLEKLLLELVKRFDADTFISSICCLTEKGELSKELTGIGIRSFYLNKKEGLDIFLPFKLAKLFKTERIDIVHTHDGTPNLYASIGAKIAGIKVNINTEHGKIYFDTTRKRFINKFLSLLNDRMVCVSNKVKEDLNEMGVSNSRLIVINNGLDLGKFSFRIEIGKKRDDLGVGKDDFVIISVGRLSREKNHTMLLEAAKYFIPEIPEAKIVIIGDGPYRGELEEYAKKIRISDKVLFLGTRQDVPEVLKASDCFVLCSNFESFGLVILEAMMAEIPVIATDAGGVGEIVKNKATGVLIRKNDVMALAKSIIEIRRNYADYKSIALRAKENVIKNYDIKKTVHDYESLYLSLR